MTAHAGERLALIASCYCRFTGRSLLPDGPAALWSAPFAVLAHGTEPDPIFFYGNRLTLQLFEVSAEAFVRTPSRRSAESLEQAERSRLLDQVNRCGFVEDYAGVRISASGRRFRIEQATVWNLIDGAGGRIGQAAAFARWTRLD